MGIVAALVDLVLPMDCAGCGTVGAGTDAGGVCDACASVLNRPPTMTRPTPAPRGLPSCLSAGTYEGPVREVILGYKERGRRGLAGMLGGALGGVVRAGWPDPAAGPVVLVPVPATAAAIRARQGDHMLRLARHCARRLRRWGYRTAVASVLRALPKVDSAHLDRVQRAAAATDAFAVRSAWALRRSSVPGRLAALRAVADCGAVVLVDDVLTTGSTLAAAAERLHGVGVPVTFAATVAATRLRHADEQVRTACEAEIAGTGSRDGGD